LNYAESIGANANPAIFVFVFILTIILAAAMVIFLNVKNLFHRKNKIIKPARYQVIENQAKDNTAIKTANYSAISSDTNHRLRKRGTPLPDHLFDGKKITLYGRKKRYSDRGGYKTARRSFL
jgi:hypothetical protein